MDDTATVQAMIDEAANGDGKVVLDRRYRVGVLRLPAGVSLVSLELALDVSSENPSPPPGWPAASGVRFQSGEPNTLANVHFEVADETSDPMSVERHELRDPEPTGEWSELSGATVTVTDDGVEIDWASGSVDRFRILGEDDTER